MSYKWFPEYAHMSAEQLIAPGGPLAPRSFQDNTAIELARAAKAVPKPRFKKQIIELGVTELGKIYSELEKEGFEVEPKRFAELCRLLSNGRLLGSVDKVELAIVSLSELGFQQGVTEATYRARVKSLGFEVFIPIPRPTRGDELGGRPNPNPFYYWNDRIVIFRGK